MRTRSSSVIDRNLSLTSLPPGAKILPGAHHGLDLRLLLLCTVFQPGPVSGQRRDSSEVLLPACSMIIEAAGSLGGLLTRTWRNRFWWDAGFIYAIDQRAQTEFLLTIGSGCRRCSLRVIEELVLVVSRLLDTFCWKDERTMGKVIMERRGEKGRGRE